MHDFRWRTTELVPTEMPEARQLPFPVYSGARIPLCYCLLIEVSQQDEEHQGRAKRKGKMLEMEKKYFYSFYLWI